MRILTEQQFDAEKKRIVAYGLSTDTKPTSGIVMGSVFVEVDTGKAFLFNETASSWVEQ